MRTQHWLEKGKTGCHNYLVTLDLAIHCIPGRLLERWAISVPATSAREGAALSAGKRTLASVPGHVGGGGQGFARLCCLGVRGIRELRTSSPSCGAKRMADIPSPVQRGNNRQVFSQECGFLRRLVRTIG